jgi:phospholipase A-2-activating protein
LLAFAAFILIPLSEISIWTFQGDVVHSLSAHTSFVYSLSILPNRDVASGGEDRTLRIWRGMPPLLLPGSFLTNKSPLHRPDGECFQTISHPAISVWSVSAMPNGDIVTGASDGIVRVFSESEERWASPQELKAFDDLVASQALPSQQVGDVKKSDLPGLEALNIPGMRFFPLTTTSSSHSGIGRKPGEVKMVQNGTITEAHQVCFIYCWDINLTRLSISGTARVVNGKK